MTKWKSLWEFKEFRAVVSCALLTTILAVSMCGVAGGYTGTSTGDGGAGGTGDDYVIGFTIDPTTATIYSGNSQQFIATATVLDTATKVTFKNIGTCDIRITPQPPISAPDTNIYKYAYLILLCQIN